ncbi:hypothetical protein E3N88_07927 [Mikania micrantha]|uniref:Uncharacterized protein n=1 Tax=Mikania micrantha TaxID=192012 RepID=A0A5N6PF87_9ASTR|nr:hypothetical protein E3N88_07927 [Mikania micrantha]
MEMEEQHDLEQQNLESNTDEFEELQMLEEDVKFMAQKIADFRQTLPEQLKDTLASIISAQRPANLTCSQDDSDPGPSINSDPGPNQDHPEQGLEAGTPDWTWFTINQAMWSVIWESGWQN